jgi:hypothetical protein
MSDTVETKTKRVAKPKTQKVAKVKVDKYNGFKVPIKSRVVTKWTIHIYDMIKEANTELLNNEAVKDAYNNLVDCLIKYEGKVETWIPSRYDKYKIGIKLKNDYHNSLQGIPGTWTIYTWQEQNGLNFKSEIKEKSTDILTTYAVLYDLIKQDVVPYMELKQHELTSKKDIECYHRTMEKLESDIKVFERSIESHRKAISDYAKKCIALQNPPITTKFD